MMVLTLAESCPRGSVNDDILIGTDFYFAFIGGKCKKRETTNAPTEVESTFIGWIIGGPIERLPRNNTQSMFSAVRIDPVTGSLKQFWEVESI